MLACGGSVNNSRQLKVVAQVLVGGALVYVVVMMLVPGERYHALVHAFPALRLEALLLALIWLGQSPRSS
jgi:hypothetical protein